MKSIFLPVRSFFRFYYEGFRNMPVWGRKSWLIILIKLFIMFAILRIFFFRDFLGSRYDNDIQRSEYVRNQILKPGDNND
jgi:hypothetical protein